MGFNFDSVAEKYDETMTNNGQLAVLKKQITTALSGVRNQYQSVLDVGMGTGLLHDSYVKLGNPITAIEPSSQMAQQLRANYPDVLIEQNPIENVEFSNLQYDLAVFTLVLSWLENWRNALEKVLTQNPKYTLISNQELTKEEKEKLGEGHKQQQEIQESFSLISSDRIDELMKEKGYYPLKVIVDSVKAGIIKTILYSKDRPDDLVYQEAKYIFQITDSCNQACAGCYAAQGKNQLDFKKYNIYIGSLSQGDTIAIRGGEPFMHKRWYEDFASPALEKGLQVIIDTNGIFMNHQNYDEILKKLSHPNITVRISFDNEHLHDLSENKQSEKFEKMALFVKEAKRQGINYSFSCLGMSAEEIDAMLKGTSLESARGKFSPLTFYSDISQLPISGKYIDTNGNELENIPNENKKGVFLFPIHP